MDTTKLKARREKLALQIKQIDSELVKAERAERDREQRELVKLIQSRGLTVAQISKMLDASGEAAGAEK